MAASALWAKKPTTACEDDKAKDLSATKKSAAEHNVALLGATGGVGRHVLLEALSQEGWTVTVLVRDRKKLDKILAGLGPKVPNLAKLRVVEGDASRREDLGKLLEACSSGNSSSRATTLISCVGATFGNRADTVMTSLAGNLLDVRNGDYQFNQESLHLVFMSTIGCGGTSPLSKFGLSCIVGFGTIADMDKADGMLMNSSSSNSIFRDVTIVRPPRIEEEQLGCGSEESKRYLCAEGIPSTFQVHLSIGQTAVASMIVNQVKEAHSSGVRAFQVYAAK